uniref:Uncharacterized protein n=2 Tax=Meloidogyne TaxID=189290 RepID=A0A6V7XLE7_MELEN|nr:unnamed protein product [Meloidogyne enterolobii]
MQKEARHIGSSRKCRADCCEVILPGKSDEHMESDDGILSTTTLTQTALFRATNLMSETRL